MEKICQGCGKRFNCIGTEKCWCNTIKISDEKKLELQSCYNECFCQECLLSKKIKLNKGNLNNLRKN